jgi:hypothetical protein
MEGKGCMGKFFAGNDAKLIGNAAPHLHLEERIAIKLPAKAEALSSLN